jgi:hypothetical protein
MDGIQQIQKEIRDKEDELYCLANTNRKSVGRLAEAHALVRIAEEEMISNGLMIITHGSWNVGIPAEKGVMSRFVLEVAV